jgi:T5SS/PEP-CTERM-associated repeat protein/autotransporter-associated beta strand protein
MNRLLRSRPARPPFFLLAVLVAELAARAGATQVTGTRTVPTDQTSPWNVADTLYVGYLYNTGTLNIQSGSTVTSAGSYIGYAANGTVNLDGAGSKWTNTGTLGLGAYLSSVGKLYLTNGAQATVAGETTFGIGSSTTSGLISVDGAGSKFTTASLLLGRDGSGTISVTGGGTLAVTSTNFSLKVATNPGTSGTISVSGTGSTFTAASQLFLGDAGSGTMTVADGGQASIAGYTYIGTQSGASSTLTVSGANATFTGHDYIITGYDGAGTLIVKDDGTVKFDASSTQHTVTLASHTGSTGTLKIGDGSAAGTLDVASVAGGSGTAQVIFNHTGAVGGGTYTFAAALENNLSVTHSGPGTTALTNAFSSYSGGTTISAGTLAARGAFGAYSSLGNGAVSVQMGGTLAGNDFITGATTVASGGTLAPDAGGTLRFDSGLTLDDGSSLDFKLGTTSSLIRVAGGTLTGSATAGGITLNLSDAGGFTAASYTLVDFAGATASSFTASDFTLGTTVSGYAYNLSLVGSTLQLTATSLSAVPEPSTYAALAGLAALGLVASKRRRRVADRDRAIN